MDDKTMIDLFDSLKREIGSFKLELKEEVQPIKEALDRIETRLVRQEALLTRWAQRPDAK
jgi:hypothetical protein